MVTGESRFWLLLVFKPLVASDPEKEKDKKSQRKKKGEREREKKGSLSPVASVTSDNSQKRVKEDEDEWKERESSR